MHYPCFFIHLFIQLLGNDDKAKEFDVTISVSKQPDFYRPLTTLEVTSMKSPEDDVIEFFNFNTLTIPREAARELSGEHKMIKYRIELKHYQVE